MRYDDDRYLDNEDDNDLWDDELEITSDDRPGTYDRTQGTGYTSGASYGPYDSVDPEPTDVSDPIDNGTYRTTAGIREEEEENDYYSEPEPKEEKRSRRERFFGRKDDDEEDEDNDYFDSDDEPAAVKKPKAPKLDPEDPDYWIEEESPLSSIIPKPGKKWKWWLGAIIALLAILIFSWIWFFRPYTDNAVKYGYIRNMERRGSLVKTFEGTMIPYKELGDPDPLYFKEVRFSVASDSLAAVMKRMMLGCVPVRVEYEMYHAPLPWKGEEKMIIIKADTADTRKILPPEYRKQ